MRNSECRNVWCVLVVFQLSDDAELTVRLHAISALQQISLVYPNASKLLNQIHVVIEKVITRDVPQVGDLNKCF